MTRRIYTKLSFINQTKPMTFTIPIPHSKKTYVFNLWNKIPTYLNTFPFIFVCSYTIELIPFDRCETYNIWKRTRSSKFEFEFLNIELGAAVRRIVASYQITYHKIFDCSLHYYLGCFFSNFTLWKITWNPVFFILWRVL